MTIIKSCIELAEMPILKIMLSLEKNNEKGKGKFMGFTIGF